MQRSIDFANEQLILDAAGSLFWPAQGILLFADLHLEKGSFLANYHHPLPNYDTADTLLRLDKLIQQYQPKKVICLGDNFHDLQALDRMSAANYQYLCNLIHTTDWLWLIGNHDLKITSHPLLLAFNFIDTIQLNKIMLTHCFSEQHPWQIVGHYHPKKTVRILSQMVTGKCFVVTARVIVMPAFGSYTGGLNVSSTDFKNAINTLNAQYYLLKNNKIWQLK
jgi:DNA ligase-associated metallophosphoesterase